MISETISHYRILKPLGAGGMGEVYLAEDTQLGRKVAIKFLPAELIADEQAKKRLVREARAAATLDHPNICAVYEVGEADGQSFIVMQFVEGETLAARLKRQGLALTEALALAAQIADALAEAHAHHIMHRDLKPQNIMLTPRGQAKVLDFGLAKVMRESAVAESEAETASRLTESGAIVGTVLYMSPEQVRGEELDGRSDIFSFGTVIYELLSGQQPFAAHSAAEIFSAILTREPPPLERYAADLPAELGRIVRKCLAKDRERRYQAMREVVIDLENVRREREHSEASASSDAKVAERVPAAAAAHGDKWRGWLATRVGLGVIILAMLMLVTLAYALFWRRAPAALQPEIKSLAVLPLKSFGREAGDDSLGLVIANEIITKMSQIGALTVRPTSAVRKYASQEVDALAAARELKVDAVLEATYQRADDRWRVSVNLLRVQDGASLWVESFNMRPSDAADIFAIQDEVSRQVAAQLQLKLSATEEARLRKRYTASLAAYDYYLKGLQSFDRKGNTVSSGAEVKAAIAWFKQAIALDPKYVLARAQLAHCYAWMALFVEADPVWVERAKQELAQAQALDPDLAELHVVRWQLLWSQYEGFQIEAAIRELRLAQQLDPSVGHSDLGIFYAHLGLEREALRALQRALEIDPTSQTNQLRLVESYVLLGRHDEAIAANDRYHSPGGRAALAYLWKKQFDEAEREIDRDRARNQLDPFVRSATALLWALKGRLREAEAEIPAIIEKAQNSRSYHHDTYNIASIYALEGKSKEAVEWLKKTVATGMPSYPLFARDPHLDRIRSDPAFVQFMAELKPRWEGYRREFGEGTMR